MSGVCIHERVWLCLVLHVKAINKLWAPTRSCARSCINVIAGAYELAYACHIHTLETHFTHTTPPLLVDLLNVLETMSITHIGSLSELNKILSKSNDKITVSRMDQMRGND